MPTIQTKNLLKRTALLTLMGFIAYQGINTASANPTQPVTAVSNFDMPKYSGQWYEIARFPMYFQRNCASDVTANYTPKTNGVIEVLNRCVKADGQTIQSIGEAKPAMTDKTAKLKVTFLPKGLRWLPFTKADYWVLALDNDYQYALVGTPNRKYLWLLSRTPTMPQTVYQQYVSIAKEQGFNTQKLVKTLHTQK